MYNNPTKFQFYPDKIEEVEVEYEGKIVSKIQYTVTEPDSAYPDMEKFLGLTSAKATEQSRHKDIRRRQDIAENLEERSGQENRVLCRAAA